MNRYVSLLFLLFGFLFLMVACKTQQTIPQKVEPKPETPREETPKIEPIPPSEKTDFVEVNFELPQQPREFRGFWVATVVNIDWPESGTDSWEKQKADFLKLLDYYQGLNFNAAIVQIRAAGDAFYPSNYAPWSRYLTGQEGKSPQTLENPLSWMIRETHLRGIEFHAWLNPYRATFDDKTELLSPDHDFFLHPDWMLNYGSKYYYNPGLPEVKEHLKKIIQEIVYNYDVDAIHFDDYFYPYKVANQEFPDQATFQKFKKSGQSIADWRRENVNTLVKEVCQTIKASKPWVQFGISPFGVWRNKDKDPNGSATQAGQTNFDDLYADPLTWMENKWIDYLIPQLYWSMDFSLASYRVLSDWWNERSFGTAVYIGNGPYKIRDNADVAWNDPEELIRQVAYIRTLPALGGNSYFSAKSLYSKNQDVAGLLKNQLYDKPVLPPAFEPRQQVEISMPQVRGLSNEGQELRLELDGPLDPAIRYVLFREGKSLESLQTAPIQKIWVGGSRVSNLAIRTSNQEFLAIHWLDHFGRILGSQVFHNLSPSLP
ncbi:MAG: family 10 glycosylhydrolase [Algoriphagus sp.]|uniref:glycoside hydrolase family 10 protein n=1 Tax=Algoriphagus sp. TaxID=1872435 RepID=UPI00179199FB|nr:family 10 glycosylhydrolase [Algoriphagus sp.]NVJ86325.1 family 10 glycosylhydrolase [Algoriphagus sp.]